MAYKRSVFPEGGYDVFKEKYDVSPDKEILVDEYYALWKKVDRTTLEEDRLNQLEVELESYLYTAENINQYQDAMSNVQKFFVENTQGYVDDLKTDSYNTIITAKDNALLSIDNKMENVINYLDGTTAGQLRNDIGNMLNSEVDGVNLIEKTNLLKSNMDNFSVTLPLDVSSYDSVAQWADILIPDEARGKALLEFLLLYGESSLQVTESEQAMLVIIEEDRFDKSRQVPFDYDQIIFKLGQKTETGQYLAWVEELLADYTRGIEKLELGLMLESGSNEIASNKYALDIIMHGEQIDGLTDYRRKFADKANTDDEVNRLDAEIQRLDTRIDGVVV